MKEIFTVYIKNREGVLRDEFRFSTQEIADEFIELLYKNWVSRWKIDGRKTPIDIPLEQFSDSDSVFADY